MPRLTALAERRFEDLPGETPSEQDVRQQATAGLDVAFAHLRAVHEAYWDHGWRREHRGWGVYPENHLWEAVYGYLDLLDAAK